MLYYTFGGYKSLGDYDHTEDGIKINLPGIGKDNIKVTVKNGQDLHITWSKDKISGSKSFSIPNIDKITAKYEDGVLYISMMEKEDNVKNIDIS